MSVEFEVTDQVARVTLNRPERLNAIDQSTFKQLNEIWLEINQCDSVRCAILTGTGRAFCAGADMKEEGPDGVQYWLQTNSYGFSGIACGGRLNVPLVAKVNGLALGGGFETILGCDIVIAAESATFGLPEARVGRLPLDGMIVLPRIVPRNLALGLMLTGGRISASEAAKWGIVNEVVPDDQLDRAVEKWVEDILSCAPLSLKAIKRYVFDTTGMEISEARRHMSDALSATLQSEDAREGVKAFQEKRLPVWKGQ
ncbi:MAG: crotonase [Rhodobacteraceae bacterium]|nr:crotonase [Paracoccaceae bacterium]MYF47223.1 crotonase [Paracoccaceae bacterium]MYI91020.1 crotonase [Paracoccaceae bacterium]